MAQKTKKSKSPKTSSQKGKPAASRTSAKADSHKNRSSCW